MSRKLFWKLVLIIATGVVALFYVISELTLQTEDGMSYLADADRQTLIEWGKQAESLYNAGDERALQQWLQALQQQEQTWMAIAGFNINHIAGDEMHDRFFKGYNLGRSVDWKIHLYFADNPVMELPFANQQVSFVIQLPDRMRPGTYWRQTKITFQIILPTILLALLAFVLYRHIMKPLLQLQVATGHFSKGNFAVRAKKLMGDRNDEFADLAQTFDTMAARIGEQLISQRQLISDLSHELRTPLTRLDIALAAVKEQFDTNVDVERISRESKNIRQLVEDTLTLAWLENERPQLQQESVELVDLLDVLVDDAKFEFPDRVIDCQFPDSALVQNSSHRAAGQALENIVRNALRYTPSGKVVKIDVIEHDDDYRIDIIDQGPGVAEQYLEAIFKPFFRVDSSRAAEGNSFGLGLALASRQLNAIGGGAKAFNVLPKGLCISVTIPK